MASSSCVRGGVVSSWFCVAIDPEATACAVYPSGATDFVVSCCDRNKNCLITASALRIDRFRVCVLRHERDRGYSYTHPTHTNVSEVGEVTIPLLPLAFVVLCSYVVLCCDRNKRWPDHGNRTPERPTSCLRVTTCIVFVFVRFVSGRACDPCAVLIAS